MRSAGDAIWWAGNTSPVGQEPSFGAFLPELISNDAFFFELQLWMVSARGDWLKQRDLAPTLENVLALDTSFALIVAAGVWTHLDPDEQQRAVATMASLLEIHGCMLLSLRHGPAPAGRISFPVSAERTIGDAIAHGLTTCLHVEAPSLQAENRAAGVTWTWLGFRR